MIRIRFDGLAVRPLSPALPGTPLRLRAVCSAPRRPVQAGPALAPDAKDGADPPRTWCNAKNRTGRERDVDTACHGAFRNMQLPAFATRLSCRHGRDRSGD